MEYLRGQIYRVNLEPTVGSEQQGNARPCVIISINPFNKKLKTVAIVPLSSSARAIPPVAVPVPSAGANSIALCHQLLTADKSRIGKYMGELSNADILAIENGIRQLYGL
jgi:mRNA interferase MazF